MFKRLRHPARGQTLVRLLPALVLLCFAGCDAVNEITGKDKEDVPEDPVIVTSNPADQESNLEVQSDSDMVTPEPPPPNPQLIVDKFKSMPSQQIVDDFLQQLAELESCKDQIQVMDLKGSRVTPEGLKFLPELTAIRELNLGGLPFRGNAYAPLAKMTGLKVLSLEASYVDDSAMQYVASLTGLRELNLNDTKVTDQAFLSLANMGELEVIRVARTPTSGAGFEVLRKQAKAPLRVIEVDETMFGQNGFQWLTNLKSLEELRAVQVMAHDGSLKGLKGCTNLKSLAIGANDVTDRGMPLLGTLKQLEKLSLRNNQGVSHVGLIVMKKLKRVYELDIEGTNCTPQAAQELKELLPGAKITWDGRIL